MKILKLFTTLCCLLFCGNALAQQAYYSSDHLIYRPLERLEMKSGSLPNSLFLSVRPVERGNIIDYITGLDTSAIKLTAADRYWLRYIAADNYPYIDSGEALSEKPVLKHFYKTKANLLAVNERHFNLYINPIIGFIYGTEADTSRPRFRNTRGVEIRGNIDDKVGFYSSIADNQAAFPSYMNEHIQQTLTLPGEGYWKPFKGYATDFFTARGYITFSPTKHIHAQFGNDKNFIGNGYRSMILSDFSKDYLFLKLNTRVWRLQYQNIFAKFTDYAPALPKPYPAKYGAFHHLSFDAFRFLNIGLFEGVMFADVQGRGRGFDPVYLNPIIFYRSVEHGLGSSDNSVMGMDINILALKRIKIYGQLLLDEFKLSELRDNRGWWGNKHALQAGFKWIDLAGLPNIDLQSELNFIKPYTYSSDTPAESYTHFDQSLAHPLGANLQEWVSILNVNSWAPLNVRLKYIMLQQGVDTAGMNYGSNILFSYRHIPNEYGVKLLQGVPTTTQFFEIVASYQVRHNLFLDGVFSYYNKSNILGRQNGIFAGGGLRLNFSFRDYLY